MSSMAAAEDVLSVYSDHTQASSSDEKISVAVRIRPLNDKEVNRNDVCDWECISSNTIVYKNALPERSLFPTAYTFDRVFSPNSSTKQVYEEAAKEISLSAVGGINASVFAYGQTSSGKTYTMSGITQCAVADIYDYIEKHPEREFVLKFSAIEIYNEAVRDLLSSENAPLRLLDDPERGTIVEKLTEEILTDHRHLMELLSVCEAQRQIGETTLNQASSRSHQILRLSIESSAREYQGAGSSNTLTAYVDFVDLAGSERASQTSSTGARLKEGSHINRSLLTLGTVIRKLSKGRRAHIPFRDSKLTRILQNSLGGNARTAIICTMSPARSYVEQSRNTLFFATCAKEISTKAQVNIVMSEKALVKQLQRELARMENELRNLELASLSSNFSSQLKEKEVLIEKMENEIKELTQQRDFAQSRVDDLLRSASEDGTSRLDKPSSAQQHFMREFDSGTHSRMHNINGLVSIDYEDHQLQLSDGIEDNFLLDDAAPRFSGPDPCQGWEEIAHKYSEHLEDSCKDVQCIEIDESSMNRNVEDELDQSRIGDALQSHIKYEGNSKVMMEDGSQREEGGESNSAREDQTNAMKRKVQELQKALEYLIEQYPTLQIDSFTKTDGSSSEHLGLSRSKSGRPILTIACGSEQVESGPENLTFSKSTSGRSLVKIPSSWFEKTPPDGNEKDYNCESTGKLSRKNSQSSMESDVIQMSRSIDDDDKTSILNFVVRPNIMPPSENYFGDNLGAPPLASNWYLVFESQRTQIVELWDAFNVPLAHRSCFFLLFKGEPSDSVYMEVELRRLFFLKNTFSQGIPKGTSLRESQFLGQASSKKTLIRERDMLSKQVHKIFPRKEREILYQKWGIPLDTKQRSRQLSQRIWQDTTDLCHIRESANLVAKLLGFEEQDQAPKEIFGLSFSPRAVTGRSRERFGLGFPPKSITKRISSSRSNLSFRWRSSMSTVA